MVRRAFFVFGLIFSVAFLSGCQSTVGQPKPVIKQSSKLGEALWIIEGQPIDFEGTQWFPKDGIETFTESEVRQIGIYEGVIIFVDKIDIKPYDRLYTKFDKYHYRYFEKRSEIK